MGPIADKIGYRANPCKEMRFASLMLGGDATGASAAEPGGRGLTAQRSQGKHLDCASFVHILKIWIISGTPPKPDPICENMESTLPMLSESLKMSGPLLAKRRSIEGEFRFATLGMDFLGRIVVVVSTYRGDDIRLISARPATPRERKHYEQGRI